eukprot:Pgem_evm1s7846
MDIHSKNPSNSEQSENDTSEKPLDEENKENHKNKSIDIQSGFIKLNSPRFIKGSNSIVSVLASPNFTHKKVLNKSVLRNPTTRNNWNQPNSPTTTTVVRKFVPVDPSTKKVSDSSRIIHIDMALKKINSGNKKVQSTAVKSILKKSESCHAVPARVEELVTVSSAGGKGPRHQVDPVPDTEYSCFHPDCPHTGIDFTLMFTSPFHPVKLVPVGSTGK